MHLDRIEKSSRPKNAACILALTTASAIVFGIVHDIFSVSVYEPYLAIYHPTTGLRGLPLALYWGVIATWWVGAIGGCMVATTCCVGTKPQLPWKKLVMPLTIGVVVLWIVAVVVWYLTRNSFTPQKYHFYFLENRPNIPSSEVPSYVATLTMHNVSYLGAAILTFILMIYSVVVRYKRNTDRKAPVVA